MESMSKFLVPFQEIIDQYPDLLKEDLQDVKKLSNIFEKEFHARFQEIDIIVIPEMYNHQTNFYALHKNIHSIQAVILSSLKTKGKWKRKLMLIFLGIAAGAILAHPKYQPTFSKEWKCLTRRSMLIIFEDGTYATLQTPFDNPKSYDVQDAIKSATPFLNEKDDLHCSCCLSDISEVRKSLLGCFHCSTFLCSQCFYDCKVNKTGLCITCNQNFQMVERKTFCPTKVLNCNFMPEPKQDMSTRQMVADALRNLLPFIPSIQEEEKRDLKAHHEFQRILQETFPHAHILISKPVKVTTPSSIIEKTFQVTFDLMTKTTRSTIIVFLGVHWGYILKHANMTSHILKHIKIKQSKCAIFYKNGPKLSYYCREFSDDDAYNTSIVIRDLKNLIEN